MASVIYTMRMHYLRVDMKNKFNFCFVDQLANVITMICHENAEMGTILFSIEEQDHQYYTCVLD
jgi:hypothetical protein